MTLSAQHRRFVKEYLVDLNATQAALRAGYATRSARQQGARLMSKAAIADAIAEGIAKQEKRLELSADRVLQGLAKVAFFDIADAYDEDNKLKAVADMPREVRDALAGIDVHFDTGSEATGFVVKLKVDGRLEALKTLAKHYKLLTDRVQLDAGPGLADLVAAAMKPPDGGK